MKYLLSLACMCLFLFVSSQMQSQVAPPDNTRVDLPNPNASNSASCNGCTTTYYAFTEFMTIACDDGDGWEGYVPDFNGTACGEELNPE